MYLKTQSFFVLGVSKSGYAAASFILSRGGKCCIYEELDSPKIAAAIAELTARGAVRVTRERAEEFIEKSDVLVISPGVPINHEIAVAFKSAGKRIVGELEFGFECLMPPIIAVTGTNGKTTTVSLIKAILDEAGEKSELLGNVGVPVSSRAEQIDGKTVCVAEVSSFQLESVSDFKPHIACVTNISPDHLTRHYTMENYIYLKRRILKNLKESEYAVLNYDDETVRSFEEGLRAKIVRVSVKERVAGAYSFGGAFYYYGEKIMERAEFPLLGEHNEYDALFAIAAAKLAGINTETIARALGGFRGVPHRVELIAEVGGVKYYDDSKSTNTASAVTAMRAMTAPTVVILGGSEKGEKYESLFAAMKASPVKHAVITGASRFSMFEAARNAGFTDVTVTADFRSAVGIAAMLAGGGDAVLLSPACASFDEFSSYEERGEVFKKEVKELCGRLEKSAEEKAKSNETAEEKPEEKAETKTDGENSDKKEEAECPRA